MKIYLAADHAGFEMKNALKEFLTSLSYEVEDFGAFELDPGDDYPTYMRRAAGAVSHDPLNSRAIILGGSGQGEAMVANKFTNVRAAVFYGEAGNDTAKAMGAMEIVRLSREHNDANVLSIGARFLNLDEAKDAVMIWLKTPFSIEERHKRRVSQINQIT